MRRFVSEVVTAVVAALVVALVLWAVSLEARVARVESTSEDIRRQHKEAVDQFRDDLSYLRSRIDAALSK